jgi:hypothetical protein
VRFQKLFNKYTAAGLLLLAIGALIVSGAATRIASAWSNETVTAESTAEIGEPQLKQDQLVSTDELAKWLNSKQPPVVFQTGLAALYESSHIPKSIFAGPAMNSEGLGKLKQEAQKISRTSDIVIYCGCCPMKDCPNITPALPVLRGMGFKKIKVLNLDNDFVQDWVNKGLPVEKS